MPENAGRTLLSQVEEEKWNARHVELGVSLQLAAVFRGWIPDGYFASGKPRILYVGKATSGRFNQPQVERTSFNGKGAFWNFARQIAAAVGCTEEGIPCIAWSNVSKISCQQIMAELSLIAGFEENAALTLESEIATTKPHVIVFVTGHFSDRVVRLVAHGHEDAEWNKSEKRLIQQKEADIWWKRRPDGGAVLWMRHPMGANRESLAYAAEKIASLTKARRPQR
jgi:hypothetical protein